MRVFNVEYILLYSCVFLFTRYVVSNVCYEYMIKRWDYYVIGLAPWLSQQSVVVGLHVTVVIDNRLGLSLRQVNVPAVMAGCIRAKRLLVCQ